MIIGSKEIRGQLGQSLGFWVFDLDNFLIPHGFYCIIQCQGRGLEGSGCNRRFFGLSAGF